MHIVAVDTIEPGSEYGCTLALGNFDGVHKGHWAVIDAARRPGRPLAAALFEPHPRQYLIPDGPPFRLQTSGQRARALAALGVETLYVIAFDAKLAAMTDARFVDEILVQRIGAGMVAVGFDFRFGHDRMGDTSSLARLGGARFETVVVDSVDDAPLEGKISSTAIRRAIFAGDLATAERMLGRPWAIEGAVDQGFQRGRTINFPTANVPLGAYIRPKFGVYATTTDIGDGVWRPGVANCGVKPTVGAQAAPLLETHIFDFAADLYGRVVETRLMHFLRPEQKFETFEALRDQIARDAQQARSLLGAPEKMS
jgi:riboflavin kinase/FMN adenylyltransferase